MMRIKINSVKILPLSYGLFLTSLLVFCGGCQNTPELYKKEFSDIENTKMPDQMTTNLIRKYGQGSISEIMVLKEALKHNPKSGEIYRELGVPYGKRGFAKEFFENYEKAVVYDPLVWQGYRGYMYLYFYRDYQRALQDFNELDALTPNFIDYPQATSVHYMRGICHLQLGEYDEAHEYWNKHIEEEVKANGEAYIDSKTFLFQALTYYRQDKLMEAAKSINRGLLIDKYSPDLQYWSAKIAFELKNYSDAKKAIDQAKIYHAKQNYNYRPYVEEFYQTYMLDIDKLDAAISEMM